MKAERSLLSLLRGEPELQINEMNKRCIICHGQIKYKFNAKDLNQKTTQDTFYYYECIDCYTQQLKNVPPNLGDYYGDYAAHELPSSIEDYKTKARNQQWRVDILKKYKKSGRLLEIGPSIGAFAYASQMNGFEVDVIEFNNLCCTYMSKNTQIKAINSEAPLEVLIKMERKYDAIVFWQSIEHLVEAPKILKRCAELLEAKGVVIIGTVEPKSLQARLFGRYWLHLDAPRHVYLFPQQALINFMHSCGLKKLGTITNDRDTNSINRVGLLVSMHHFLKLPSKNIFNKSLYWIWRCIICRLIDPIFQSAAYIVIFGNE